ncbi:MAG: hypothetical protein RR087_02685 [Oscillospiraceae bacterium]
MKKIFLFALSLFLCLILFIGCAESAAPQSASGVSSNINSAISPPSKTVAGSSVAPETADNVQSAVPPPDVPSEITDHIDEYTLSGIKFTNVVYSDIGGTADCPVNYLLSGTIKNESATQKKFGFSYSIFYDDKTVFLSKALSHYNYQLEPNQSMQFSEPLHSAVPPEQFPSLFSINSLVPFEEKIDTLTVNSPPPSTSPENDYHISIAEFNELSEGMEYAEVCKIIGSEGVLLSESGEEGTPNHIAMYQWDGSGSMGANANAVFSGKLLISKAQFGLK